MNRIDIVTLNKDAAKYEDKEIVVAGWVRNLRCSKAVGFIELNDGSGFKPVQVVFEEAGIDNFKEISALNIGASLQVKGKVVMTPTMRQPFEIHAVAIEVQGESTPDYPLQNKRHSMEFLRTVAHLRPRTNMFSAVFRVRS
ncbi:MAG: asparagine--tRNA ligase, partial [Clostridia bacterium]|nr:asparagine--tRNA ligase [Clostridia bacterium]